MGSEDALKRDASDFMLEEYKQIVAAFFDLSRQKSQMFRFYLILVTIPISLIAAILGIEETPLSIFNLPILVVLVIIAIAIAGLIMTAIVVDIRFESILYAKTVNLVRRFFKDIGKDYKLHDYLVLPYSDEFPKYYEQPWEFKKWQWKWELGVGATFLEVLLMGLLNATYFGLAMVNISTSWFCNDQSSLWFGFIIWTVFFLIHILGYRYFAKKKDEQWEARAREIA